MNPPGQPGRAVSAAQLPGGNNPGRGELRVALGMPRSRCTCTQIFIGGSAGMGTFADTECHVRKQHHESYREIWGQCKTVAVAVAVAVAVTTRTLTVHTKEAKNPYENGRCDNSDTQQ